MIKLKGTLNGKMFIIADQLKEGNKFQRKTIETQKNQTEVLNKSFVTS